MVRRVQDWHRHRSCRQCVLAIVPRSPADPAPGGPWHQVGRQVRQLEYELELRAVAAAARYGTSAVYLRFCTSRGPARLGSRATLQAAYRGPCSVAVCRTSPDERSLARGLMAPVAVLE